MYAPQVQGHLSFIVWGSFVIQKQASKTQAPHQASNAKKVHAYNKQDGGWWEFRKDFQHHLKPLGPDVIVNAFY